MVLEQRWGTCNWYRLSEPQGRNFDNSVCRHCLNRNYSSIAQEAGSIIPLFFSKPTLLKQTRGTHLGVR